MLIKALAAAAGNFGVTGYAINDSLRFNDNDSAYLSRTPSVAGNRKTWTFSAWVKLGNSGATRTLFAARLATSNSDSLQVYLTSNDQINVGGVSYGITATPVLRDPSGWYHIVLSYDTTQATDTNRAKIYINGIQASVTGTYPSINLDTPINNTQAHNLGRRPTENDRYFDGYMSEINFIDGQALTPDDFGEINEDTGEWSPKKYSGTYGTNGFYLNFADGSELGKDASDNLPSPVALIDNDMESSIPTFTGGYTSQSADRAHSPTHSMQVNITSPTSLATHTLSSSFIASSGGKFSFWFNCDTLDDDDVTFYMTSGAGAHIGIDFKRQGSSTAYYYQPTSSTTTSLADTGVTLSADTWYFMENIFNGTDFRCRLYDASLNVLFEYTGPHYGATYTEIRGYSDDGDSVFYIDDLYVGQTGGFTTYNLASTDQMLDTPTNNFSVLQNSPLGTGATYQEGNLEFNNATYNSAQSGSTIRFASGKWYCEVTPTLNGDLGWYGVRNPQTGDYWIYYGFSGNKWSYISGTLTQAAYGSAYTVGDVIGISYNADTGDLQFYKNNVAQGVIATGFAGQELDFYFADGASDDAHNGVLNFGQDSSFAGLKTRQGNTDANGIGDFYYTPPTGYLALCTDNLPAPAIEQPETQFNVVTYTGNGTTPQSITGVGFQPDLVWIKRRDSAADNTVLDVLRGDARLESNNTNAELGGNANVFGSFDSDGFTTGWSAQTGASGGTYVAWCWKAGGTAVTNTNGSITSQVSANVDAGFSIVGYAGNGSAGTVGHGLSSAPEMIIVKSRNDVTNWPVYHVSTGNTGQTYLSAIDAFATSSVRWNNTSPTSSVFSLGTATNVNGSGYNFIAYCFHSVESFSKIGSYVGNGSANGPFVYTGFKPSFIMYKRAIGGTGNWNIADNMREGHNWDNPSLYPNLTNAESGGSSLDILSNGFKINNAVAGSDHNASGSTYIYMAFAEHPFNYATGR